MTEIGRCPLPSCTAEALSIKRVLATPKRRRAKAPASCPSVRWDKDARGRDNEEVRDGEAATAVA